MRYLAQAAIRSSDQQHLDDTTFEKPLTNSVEQAEALVRLAREQGRVLMVVHTFEYNPAVNEPGWRTM